MYVDEVYVVVFVVYSKGCVVCIYGKVFFIVKMLNICKLCYNNVIYEGVCGGYILR